MRVFCLSFWRRLAFSTSAHLPSCRDVAAAKNLHLNWAASNGLYRRNPRLLYLEECHRSPWLLRPMLAYVVVSGLFRNAFIASRILDILCNADVRDLSCAALVFDQMDRANTFSWNTMIRSFAESVDHPPSTTFSFYRRMLESRARTDKYTYPFLLGACRTASDVTVGRLVHTHCSVSGFSTDLFVQTALVNMYLRCGCIGDAHRLFDVMPKRDIVSWTGVLSGLAVQGYFGQALELFNEIISNDSVRPNVATVVSVMLASSNFGSLSYTSTLHAYLEKVGFVADVFVSNSLIDAYAKCGSVASSCKIFHLMQRRDLHSWTAAIMGLATHGMARAALDLFDTMKCTGIMPDSTCFLAVLSACSHRGLVDLGVNIFESMKRDYKLVPGLKHYGCMVDLFSRAGLLDQAYKFLRAMPMKPNLAVLGSLLSACRNQSKVEMAEITTKEIESSCEHTGGSHVLLSNMYACQSRWQQVSAVRRKASDARRKPPGQSCVEVDGVVHRFAVEQKSHPYFTEMKFILDTFGKVVDC